MSKPATEDKRLTRVTSICLSLPETSREDHGEHAGFLVRKKHFAYYVNNHHGDGIVAINCKALPGDNVRLIAAEPDKFYSPAYLGSRGWVGLRLDCGKVDWDEARELLIHSYLQCAPRRLAAVVESAEGVK